MDIFIYHQKHDHHNLTVVYFKITDENIGKICQVEVGIETLDFSNSLLATVRF